MAIETEPAPISFTDLESRFGHESACDILRTLEQFEGIREELVKNMTLEERMDYVLGVMNSNMLYQTRH